MRRARASRQKSSLAATGIPVAAIALLCAVYAGYHAEIISFGSHPPGAAKQAMETAETSAHPHAITRLRESSHGSNTRRAGHEEALSEDQYEELARHDPERALRLAAMESDTVRALDLRHRVLRIWAAKNPDAAAAWANALPNGEWQPALTAALVGAAAHPHEAVRVTRALCSVNPSQAADIGGILIKSLATVGAYETGAHFALAEDDTEHRAAWVNTAFFHYGLHQPNAAMPLAEGLAGSAARADAFRGAISGWAANNPAQVASYAMGRALGDDRTYILSEALPQWVSRDGKNASAWILQFDPLSEMDAGAVAVATQPGLVQQQPDAAFRWAASISEPTLRANTLRSLALQCAPQQAQAIREFIARTPDLPESDRCALLDALNPPPDA